MEQPRIWLRASSIERQGMNMPDPQEVPERPTPSPATPKPEEPPRKPAKPVEPPPEHPQPPNEAPRKAPDEAPVRGPTNPRTPYPATDPRPVEPGPDVVPPPQPPTRMKAPTMGFRIFSGECETSCGAEAGTTTHTYLTGLCLNHVQVAIDEIHFAHGHGLNAFKTIAMDHEAKRLAILIATRRLRQKIETALKAST